jgi:hypothetical protein
MAQSLILDQRGLYTYASPISGVPSGSLAVAQNVNINRENIIEPRRGFDFLAYRLPLSTDRVADLVFWNSQLFAHYGTTFAYYDPTLVTGGFKSRGTLSRPTSANHLSVVNSQNKNLYIAASTGLKKTDAIGTSLYSAGIPKGLTMDLALAGAGTALEINEYVTYRYLIGRKDANSNFQYGGVSARATIQGTSSKQDVNVTCYLPSGLDATYFIQLYKITSTVSATSDELQLCYESPLTTATSITIKDIVPSDLVGATIYTAASQQGATSDNAVPPLARDIAEYKGCLWYADIESPQRLTFSLVSVSGTGFVASDTITITRGAVTEVYTGYASFDHTNKRFQVFTGASPASNIDSTIKSFIKCVNLASAIVTAYSMVTKEEDLPGKVMLESKTISDVVFTAVSTRPAAFQPQLPATATISSTSTADTFKNGLMWSKLNQQEAVPIKNILKAGGSEDRILKIVPVREGMFVLKEKDGAFILRGNTEADWNLQLLDNTAKLVSARSVVVVNNLVYGLFESGIMELTDTGATIISNPIKDQILPLFSANMIATVKSYAFGIGNNIDGKYILSVPILYTDTATNKQIVFDTFGRTFTNWSLPFACGDINPADSLMYAARYNNEAVLVERKASEYTDFADYEATCTVTSFNGTTVYINNTSGMAKGDILYQGITALAYIESVSNATGSIVIDSAQTWVLNTADVIHMKAIDCKIQWNPDVGGNAAALKQYYECSLISKANFQKDATMYFTTDINPSESYIEITSPSGNGAFGQFIFGDEVFGGDQSSSPKRIGIPRTHARCSALSVRFENKVAYSDFQIEGLALSFNVTSTRTAR